MEPQHEHERARDDARTSNEFGRAAAQAAILINGGAATALLALVRATGSQKEIISFVPALASYALGVFLAAIALAFASRSIELYMQVHETQYYGKTAKEDACHANRFWHLTISSIVNSLFAFVISTGWLAVDLGRILKASG